jgi:hypothetical protein
VIADKIPAAEPSLLLLNAFEDAQECAKYCGYG